MGQLLVRKIEDSLKEQLRAQAKAKGRSLEEEARAILKGGVGGQSATSKDELGWATRFNRRFARLGLSEADFRAFEDAIESLRGSPARAAKFE